MGGPGGEDATAVKGGEVCLQATPVVVDQESTPVDVPLGGEVDGGGKGLSVIVVHVDAGEGVPEEVLYHYLLTWGNMGGKDSVDDRGEVGTGFNAGYITNYRPLVQTLVPEIPTIQPPVISLKHPHLLHGVLNGALIQDIIDVMHRLER